MYNLCGAVPLLVVEEVKAAVVDVLELPVRQDQATVEELEASRIECIRLKQALEYTINQRDMYMERAAEASVPAPDPEAAMYKRMYYELLDRIVQRG